jgi:hypothetical protein
MPHNRALEGLRRHTDEKSAAKQEAVFTAIRVRAEAAQPLTVSALARDAGVSREFIYSHDHLLSALREAQKAPKPPAAAFMESAGNGRGALADRSTLLAHIQRLKARLAGQQEELADLKKQRQRWLGQQVADANAIDPEEHAELRIANERLMADNTALTRRVDELRRLNAILEEDLAASRQAHMEDVAAFTARDADVVSLRPPSGPGDR